MDHEAKSVNDLLKRRKALLAEAFFTQFFTDLFNGFISGVYGGICKVLILFGTIIVLESCHLAPSHTSKI